MLNSNKIALYISFTSANNGTQVVYCCGIGFWKKQTNRETNKIEKKTEHVKSICSATFSHSCNGNNNLARYVRIFTHINKVYPHSRETIYIFFRVCCSEQLLSVQLAGHRMLLRLPLLLAVLRQVDVVKASHCCVQPVDLLLLLVIVTRHLIPALFLIRISFKQVTR